jgi:hypothetical protein
MVQCCLYGWGTPPRGPKRNCSSFNTSRAVNNFHFPFLIISTNYSHMKGMCCLANWRGPPVSAAAFWANDQRVQLHATGAPPTLKRFSRSAEGRGTREFNHRWVEVSVCIPSLCIFLPDGTVKEELGDRGATSRPRWATRAVWTGGLC